MSRAFEELFSISEAFRGVPMAGRTDAWILSDAAAAHGIPLDSPALARFHAVYIAHLERELQNEGSGRKGLMPGVRELLEAMSPLESAYIALLTGNYEAGARLKLQYFDLWRYFRCGAFGDDAPDRNGLLPRAVARVAACGGPSVSSSDAIIIGDTPLDIACAAAGGARSIGVATGSHSVDQLREAGADAVFEDLSDSRAVLDALGLSM
jgi:phosphoglycolate phosphatase-like HAD superfamily hydrolase